MGFIPEIQGWSNILKSINVMHHINKKTEITKRQIISIDAEKAFDKVQHPFRRKTLSKVGVEGAYFNICSFLYKGHIQETYGYHHNQWAKTKSFPPKIRNKSRVSSFTTSIQHSIGSSSHSDQTRKRNKSHPN